MVLTSIRCKNKECNQKINLNSEEIPDFDGRNYSYEDIVFINNDPFCRKCFDKKMTDAL